MIEYRPPQHNPYSLATPRAMPRLNMEELEEVLFQGRQGLHPFVCSQISDHHWGVSSRKIYKIVKEAFPDISQIEMYKRIWDRVAKKGSLSKEKVGWVSWNLLKELIADCEQNQGDVSDLFFKIHSTVNGDRFHGLPEEGRLLGRSLRCASLISDSENRQKAVQDLWKKAVELSEKNNQRLCVESPLSYIATLHLPEQEGEMNLALATYRDSLRKDPLDLRISYEIEQFIDKFTKHLRRIGFEPLGNQGETLDLLNSLHSIRNQPPVSIEETVFASRGLEEKIFSQTLSSNLQGNFKQRFEGRSFGEVMTSLESLQSTRWGSMSRQLYQRLQGAYPQIQEIAMLRMMWESFRTEDSSLSSENGAWVSLYLISHMIFLWKGEYAAQSSNGSTEIIQLFSEIQEWALEQIPNWDYALQKFFLGRSLRYLAASPLSFECIAMAQGVWERAIGLSQMTGVRIHAETIVNYIKFFRFPEDQEMFTYVLQEYQDSLERNLERVKAKDPSLVSSHLKMRANDACWCLREVQARAELGAQDYLGLRHRGRVYKNDEAQHLLSGLLQQIERIRTSYAAEATNVQKQPK